jgi:hypothetical protein
MSKDEEDDLPALFRDDLPDKLTSDLLALAHLSDVEEDAPQETGPIRRSRTKNKSKPYGPKQVPAKTEEEKWNDEMKELEFRARAWKPFRNDKKLNS